MASLCCIWAPSSPTASPSSFAYEPWTPALEISVLSGVGMDRFWRPISVREPVPSHGRLVQVTLT